MDIVLYAVAALSCIIVGAASVHFIKKNNIVAQTTTKSKKFLKKMTKNSSIRKNSNEKESLQQGKKKNKSLLLKIDIALEKSGIRRKFPFFVTEVFVLTVLLLCVVIFLAVDIFTKRLLYAFAAVVIFLFAVYFILYLLVQRSEKLIEDNLLQFADLLESYSLTSDDIATIFENIYENLDEPLRSALLICVSEMKVGDQRGAFNRLKLKFNNRSLNELLTNIEECSRNNANYGSVVRGIHSTLETHLAEKEDRKKLANGARLNILIMMGVDIFSLNAIGSFIGDNIIPYMQSSAGGTVVLIGQFAVLMYCIYKLFTLGRK